MGAPGSGKGTFGSMLAKDLKIPTVTLGDEIRKISSENSNPFYQPIFDAMHKGALINDGIVWAILTKKVNSSNISEGFLLDGYPRKIEQALIMELCNFKYDLVINLKQHEEVIIAKMLGRRVCTSCGANFNIADIKFEGYSLPPRKPLKRGICDSCGGKLESRKDDTKKTISKRLFEYKVHTLPLEDYFAKTGKLYEFTAYAGVSDYPKLLEGVKERLEIKV
ncbi:hypothetical protein SteCoe_18228 [Stentor coeruleus]|uniref:Adenylate kinase active site lid domain-containing protein n=1 Tax=Stentor coeruleus TaxID=5963 RepID=A0A1R2BX35_9CILI|nr:hypothetical protein SteCoe_18228 [Stentor coeruleus]